jgi:hypothetical protein
MESTKQVIVETRFLVQLDDGTFDRDPQTGATWLDSRRSDAERRAFAYSRARVVEAQVMVDLPTPPPVRFETVGYVLVRGGTVQGAASQQVGYGDPLPLPYLYRNEPRNGTPASLTPRRVRVTIEEVE